MSEKENPIFGEGRFLKTCAGCGKQFRTDARNARLGPPDVCKCLERRYKLRLKRRKERRRYHRDPSIPRALSRTRAEARKIMESYLRRNELEPACQAWVKQPDGSFAPCKHHGWSSWKHILHVHHRWGDPFKNPTCDEEIHFLGITCRRHHDLFDRAVEGHGALELWSPPAKSFVEELVELRATQPRRFFAVSVHTLYKEYHVSS